jgi:hypothetical protein
MLLHLFDGVPAGIDSRGYQRKTAKQFNMPVALPEVLGFVDPPFQKSWKVGIVVLFAACQVAPSSRLWIRRGCPCALGERERSDEGKAKDHQKKLRAESRAGSHLAVQWIVVRESSVKRV